MRRLRKSIALHLILVLAACALTSLPIYAGTDPQGQTQGGQQGSSGGPSAIDWIKVILPWF